MGHGGVETKSMIDIVLVKMDMLRYMQGVKAVKGMGQGLSDHHVVLCKSSWGKELKQCVMEHGK